MLTHKLFSILTENGFFQRELNGFNFALGRKLSFSMTRKENLQIRVWTKNLLWIRAFRVIRVKREFASTLGPLKLWMTMKQ